MEHTLQLLNNVISYYEVSTNVEHIIEKGPGSYAEGGVELDIYLQSLSKLAKAQKYFEKHIPQSVELENVVCSHHLNGPKCFILHYYLLFSLHFLIKVAISSIFVLKIFWTNTTNRCSRLFC